MSVIVETAEDVVCDEAKRTDNINGIIMKLKESLSRRSQWLICLLHCNDLLFRNFLSIVKRYYLQYDKKNLPLEKFVLISGMVKDVDDFINKDHSTDQLIFLRSCLAVQCGQSCPDFEMLEKSIPVLLNLVS